MANKYSAYTIISGILFVLFVIVAHWAYEYYKAKWPRKLTKRQKEEFNKILEEENTKLTAEEKTFITDYYDGNPNLKP